MKQFLFLLAIAFLVSCSSVSKEPVVNNCDSLACDSICVEDALIIDTVLGLPAISTTTVIVK